MGKTSIVLHQELINTFTRRSYLVFAFGIPLLAVILFGGVKLFQSRFASDNPTTGQGSGSQSKYNLAMEGYVDRSGIVTSIPDPTIADRLIPFPDENLAVQAMENGSIQAYYLIPQDFLKTGRIEYVYPNTRSYLSDGQDWIIRWILTVNLLDQNVQLADRLWNPIWSVQETNLSQQSPAGTDSGEDCSRPGSACQSSKLVRLIPVVLSILLFSSLMVSSSMMLNCMGIEKENRTIEVLLSSLNPRQLLLGKTMALGIAGLVQVFVWLAVTLILINFGGSILRLPQDFDFPFGIVLWSLLLFCGGFMLYAGLMAGIGALVHNLKEVGIANVIIMFPLFFGYLIGLYAPITQATGATFPIIFSIIPFTSPVVMVMRLADNVVPIWQLLLTIGLLFLTAFLVFRMVTALFRAQNLLSGQPFSMMRYLRALAGR